MTLGRNASLPPDTPEDNSDNWKKRQKYVHKLKDNAWKRQIHKYLATLQERYSLNHKERCTKININDVVMVNGEEKNRGKWKTGVLEELHIVT